MWSEPFKASPKSHIIQAENYNKQDAPMGYSPKEVREQSQAGREIQNMEKTILSIATAVEQLTESLHPLLKPEQPQPSDVVGRNPPDVDCSLLTQTLFSFNQNLSQIQHRLIILRERLDLF